MGQRSNVSIRSSESRWRNDSGRLIRHNLLPGSTPIQLITRVVLAQPRFDTLLRDEVIIYHQRRQHGSASAGHRVRLCIWGSAGQMSSLVLDGIKRGYSQGRWAIRPGGLLESNGGVIVVFARRRTLCKHSVSAPRAITGSPGKRFSALWAAYHSHGFFPLCEQVVYPHSNYTEEYADLSTFVRLVIYLVEDANVRLYQIHWRCVIIEQGNCSTLIASLVS